MKVEIWSDIMCPFCYIGKRRFENALKDFPHRSEMEIEWKSFLLNPAIRTDPGRNINEYLSETKGWSPEQAKQANNYVTKMAKEVGLHYDFNNVVVANTFDAHRLIQLAKANNKSDETEERLFRAYFIEGKNIADHDTLILLGTEAGLPVDAIKKMLNSDEYSDNVEKDINDSRLIGVRGVPYFVFNDQYAVSGAQRTETFLDALNKAWHEWENRKPELKL
jgi:predicted DsbA family dithiol-disulfide isomerase